MSNLPKIGDVFWRGEGRIIPLEVIRITETDSGTQIYLAYMHGSCSEIVYIDGDTFHFHDEFKKTEKEAYEYKAQQALKEAERQKAFIEKTSWD